MWFKIGKFIDLIQEEKKKEFHSLIITIMIVALNQTTCDNFPRNLLTCPTPAQNRTQHRKCNRFITETSSARFCVVPPKCLAAAAAGWGDKPHHILGSLFCGGRDRRSGPCNDFGCTPMSFEFFILICLWGSCSGCFWANIATHFCQFKFTC